VAWRSPSRRRRSAAGESSGPASRDAPPAAYSNFAGKDELFLAALDGHLADRLRTYADLIFDEERIEDAYRAVARVGVEADRREPEWAGLQLEFLAHASRRESLRAAVCERRERFLDVIADLVEELASRHGVSYRLPVKEVVRGSGALLRGMSIERLLGPESTSASAALYEEMHVAYMTGLTEEPTPRSADERGMP
jgi:AcrR family transcriptional regulator